MRHTPASPPHPVPPPQRHAARKLGRLVGLGLLPREEARKVLALVRRRLLDQQPHLDARGVTLHLVWDAKDGERGAESEVRAAEDAIWRALQPALQRRASGPELLRIAAEANPSVFRDDLGNYPNYGVLPSEQVREIVERAIRVHLSRLKRGAAA